MGTYVPISVLSPLKIFSKSLETGHPSHLRQLRMSCCGCRKAFSTTDLVLAVPLYPFCVWIQVVLASVTLLGLWFQPEAFKRRILNVAPRFRWTPRQEPQGQLHGTTVYESAETKGLRMLLPHLFLAKGILADPQPTALCKVPRL